jgi:hypothetical protein
VTLEKLRARREAEFNFQFGDSDYGESDYGSYE